MSRICFLRCLSDSNGSIRLPHGEVVIVGRSKTTKIKDPSCSREQIYLKADCKRCAVEVKQLGLNPSGLDGFALSKSASYLVHHGSKLELLLNQYFYVIEFDPPPNDVLDQKEYGKRKFDEKFEDDNIASKKKKLLDLDPVPINKGEASTSTKEKSQDMWECVDGGELYIYNSKDLKSSPKIAAFDMDGTLIKTKSGKVHPVDLNDWQIAFSCARQKLKELLDQGFKLVIFSNQAPIGNGRVKIEDFKKKIEGIVQCLDVPFQVYIATGKGMYRKPMTGMWKTLVDKKNDGLLLDIDKSFYCGDAAGRLAGWAPGKKKDHSMADKLFAENLGLKFCTPEEFFLGHSTKNVPMARPEFNPKDLEIVPFNDRLISKEKEILVLVGYPGSGKSFLSKQIEQKSFHRYVAVCRDVLGAWQKCTAKATEFLRHGKSVIVDSTNPDLESRARWTSLARDMDVQCRCVLMKTSKAHAQHNNKFREIMKINHVPVNDIVFNTYKNKFAEPAVCEGFKEIIEVKFSPTFGNDDEAAKLYNMYLLEK